MTTVYGVTMYGAKAQVRKQLSELDVEPKQLTDMTNYLTVNTFKCLKDLFSSARTIQV